MRLFARFAPIAALLALAACGGKPNGLAAVTGPLVPLNPAHWQPTPAEMAALSARVEAAR